MEQRRGKVVAIGAAAAANGGAAPLRRGPSIAVLPFGNLSGDPGQRYLTRATCSVRRLREPALADMLDDPIVTALMTADGVGRRDLEANLHRLTALLPARPRRARSMRANTRAPS